MAVRDIVLYPDPPLTKKAEAFARMGPHVAKLAADMFETMAAHDGCGLAGPQVGVSKHIIVLHEPESDRRLCLVNPELSEGEGNEVREEGCLSLPHVYAPVARFTGIHVRAFSELGKPLEFDATGLLARIIQHETDHLDGIVFLDRVDVLTREAKSREWKEVRKQMLAPVGGR
jgi:peptide deformylase